MTVKRIVANIAATSVDAVQRFYAEVFDMQVVMDHGWIATMATGNAAPVQISIATQGGSGTAVPDLSIEVEDVDALYDRVTSLGYVIEYPLTDEPWGVRRFYMRDPTGKLLNILSHPDG